MANSINGSTINECYNASTIIQKDDNIDSTIGYVGGIIASVNSSKVSNSYNVGDIISNGRWVSGIASSLTRGSEIENCYNLGNITVENSQYLKLIGGITSNTYYDAGSTTKSCKISNSYNIAEIKIQGNNFSNNKCIGGIIGYIQNGHISIENSYNTGNLIKNVSGVDAGGICGKILNFEKINLTNCSTSSLIAIGRNEATNANAKITNIKENQVDMIGILEVINKNNQAFVSDTKNVNNGYPILEWQINKL